MQGNIVTAAKWLGASLVLACVILVGGLHWVISSHAGRPITPMPAHRVDVTSTTPPARVEKPLAASEAFRRGGNDTTQTAAPDTRPEGALLSMAEAIRIAKQAVERRGIDLRSYKEPEASYDKHNGWYVFFQGRASKPGNFFSISVVDRTGKTHFDGGE